MRNTSNASYGGLSLLILTNLCAPMIFLTIASILLRLSNSLSTITLPEEKPVDNKNQSGGASSSSLGTEFELMLKSKLNQQQKAKGYDHCCQFFSLNSLSLFTPKAKVADKSSQAAIGYLQNSINAVKAYKDALCGDANIEQDSDFWNGTPDFVLCSPAGEGHIYRKIYDAFNYLHVEWSKNRRSRGESSQWSKNLHEGYFQTKKWEQNLSKNSLHSTEQDEGNASNLINRTVEEYFNLLQETKLYLVAPENVGKATYNMLVKAINNNTNVFQEVVAHKTHQSSNDNSEDFFLC